MIGKGRLAGLSAWCALLALLLAALPVPETNAETNTVTVFAAASTTDVMTAIGRLFNENETGRVDFSFAASSTLAKQIENGAPADIFLSADQAWMDYLADKMAIDPDTRADLLGNRIVLVAPANSDLKSISIVQGIDLTAALNGGRLAMGDPDHVPAGRYGKAALETLAAWGGLANHIAPCQTVRSALALVERGETPLGIVYATDAAVSAKVRVVGTFPAATHSPITYPLAMVTGRQSPAVHCFFQFLQSPAARAIFEQAGFTVLE
jgi:molybdate transport system substrate-binding protein